MKIKVNSLFFVLILLFGAKLTSLGASNNKIIPHTKYLNAELPASYDSPIPLAAGGEEPLKTDIISYGNFENAEDDGSPKWLTDYSDYGTGYAYTNFSYEEMVHGGTKACMIESSGTTQKGSIASARTTPSFSSSYAYLSDTITLNFWHYILSLPDLKNGSYIRLYLRFYNEISHLYYYLSYYLAYHTDMGSNETYTGRIYLNSTFSTWQNFNRDISSDFAAVFAIPVTNIYIQNVEFDVYSSSNPVGFARWIIDDVSLTDSSSNEYINNGDFELGSPSGWISYNTGPGTLFLTNTHTEGEKALNMTAYSYYPGARSYAYLQTDIYSYHEIRIGWNIHEPDDVIIQFDWWYNDVNNGGTDEYAYLSIHFQNETYSYYMYFYLGCYNDILIGSNYTGSSSMALYFLADSFGSRSTWNHQNIDLYDYTVPLNITNMPMLEAEFYISAGSNANATTTLLIDNFKIIANPLNDPGFEEDYYSSPTQPIPSWLTYGSTQYINHTSEAHSGSYAVNVSLYGTSAYLRRQNMAVKITQGFFTDFWYKIDNLPTLDSYAYISLAFNDSYYIYYILAETGSVAFANYSNHCYYILSELNQTGVWLELVRNLYEDLMEAFGQAVWILETIDIYIYNSASASDPITILLDDMNFVLDTHPPVISNVSLLKTPMYYENAEIEITAYDILSRVSTVQVFYRNDSTWYSINAIKSGLVYRATIPSGQYGTTYQFYIRATDYMGLSAIDDNGGHYYSYTIGDDIEPTISILSPANSTTLTDMITIRVTTSDLGSDIDHVEYYVDGQLVGNSSASPFTLDWNTRGVVNGLHTLTAKVYDQANNYATDTVKVYTENDFNPPELSEVQLLPDPLKANKPVTVLVGVTDETEIQNVTLYYKLGNESWVSVSMINNASLYSAEIPGVGYNIKVLYYIEASDTYGQKSYLGTIDKPLNYVIKPTISTIYNNYGMLLGAGAVILLYGLIKLILWRAGKKK